MGLTSKLIVDQTRFRQCIVDPAEMVGKQVDPSVKESSVTYSQSAKCISIWTKGILLVILRRNPVGSTLHHDLIPMRIHPCHFAVADGVRVAIGVHITDCCGIQPSLPCAVRAFLIPGGKCWCGRLWLWVGLSHLLLHEGNRTAVFEINFVDDSDLGFWNVAVGDGLVPCTIRSSQRTVFGI